MSGPKRADVEAQLNVARGAQRKCAGLVSKAKDSAINALISDAGTAVNRAQSAQTEIDAVNKGFTSEMKRVASESITQITAEVKAAGSEAQEARQALENAQASVKQAKREQAEADRIFIAANQAFEEAASALRSSGGHYLTGPMAQARQATLQLDAASNALRVAENTRKQAEQRAGTALRQARNSLSVLDSLRSRISAVKDEAQTRVKAEEDARRITEEKKRNAVLALDNARAALDRINDLPHGKFAPGMLLQQQKALSDINRQIADGKYDLALASADRVNVQARRLEQDIVDAHHEFERRRNEAESSASELEAAIGGVDPELIAEWSGAPEAVKSAQAALDELHDDITSENYDGVTGTALNAREVLMEAMRRAAENKSNHEKRLVIGEAVMDVMEELGFEIAYDEGGLDGPMKISGQTPNTSGRGDFGIDIPLDGEVDFHVNAPEGDTTCVATIEALQDRLRERGVAWNTTDWGHAEGAQITEQTKTRQKEKVKHKNGLSS